MRKSPPIFNGRASSTVILKQALRRLLHRQLLAAAATAGSQNTTAVLGRHPGTEAMHLAALALLGLISTEHGQHSSQIQTRLRIPGDDPVREHLTMHVHSADSLINISECANACQAFFGIPTGIQPLFFTACTPYTISCSSAKTRILRINSTSPLSFFLIKKKASFRKLSSPPLFILKS